MVSQLLTKYPTISFGTKKNLKTQLPAKTDENPTEKRSKIQDENHGIIGEIIRVL